MMVHGFFSGYNEDSGVGGGGGFVAINSKNRISSYIPTHTHTHILNTSLVGKKSSKE